MTSGECGLWNFAAAELACQPRSSKIHDERAQDGNVWIPSGRCLFLSKPVALSEPVAFRWVYGLESTRGRAGDSLSVTQECCDTN